ncbi:MAG: hypothetical protein NTX48_07850 [Planctomycetales bacterium]|nr:hypothetical protein [Planctomycetales bacterium]
MNEPSTNGHDNAGRFVPGNPGGPGNPHSQQVARLRSAMMAAVSDDDMREVVAKLVDLAKSGDVPAIKLLMDRCLGKVPSPEPAVAIQVVNNQPAEDDRGRVMRIAQSVLERRRALYTGSGMEPPAELRDEPRKSAREILDGFRDRWQAEDDAQTT